MAENIILSILTPAVPSRLSQLGKLCEEIESQIGNLPVEHLVLLDNKRRTVGEKRDALLRAARGKYVAFVDDDDFITMNYIEELLKAAPKDPDVITFEQMATVNNVEGIIQFRLGNPNDPFKERDVKQHYTASIVRRNAWHVCAWRRTLAILSHFPASNYGEDWAYAAPLCAMPNLKEEHIPKVLHFYRHSSQTTEAPPPMTPS
jgi:glycosyltransferase involved in cell wall biosynthesis